MIAGNITIKSENSEYGIETNADSVAMDANNNKKSAFNAKPYIISSGVKSYLSGLSSDIPFYFEYQAYDKSDNEVALQNTNKKYGTSGADVVSESPYNVTIEDSESSGKVSYLKLILSVNGSIVYTKMVYLNRDLPVVFSRSETWNSGLSFKNGQVIISNGVVYQWSYPHAGNSSVNPSTDITNNPTTTHWVAYQQWTLLATKIIMAAFALLGGAVFNGDYMYSQDGKDASGNATSNYELFDASKLGTASCPFTPNLYFNYKTGDTYQANGTFSGMVKASSLYTPFKNIPLSGGGTYNYDPAVDGNFIRVYASGYAGGYVTINMPSASKWSGAHLFIRVPELLGTITTITTIYSSDGFKFPLGKNPIDNYQDSTYSLHPRGGVYEFVSDGINWIPFNYNVNIGPLVHTVQYLLAGDTSLTISPTTTYVRCANNNTGYVSLPNNPFVGQEVKVFRAGSGTVIVEGNGHSIFAAETTVSSVSMAHINELDYFIYNGTTWDYSYGNWN